MFRAHAWIIIIHVIIPKLRLLFPHGSHTVVTFCYSQYACYKYIIIVSISIAMCCVIFVSLFGNKAERWPAVCWPHTVYSIHIFPSIVVSMTSQQCNFGVLSRVLSIITTVLEISIRKIRYYLKRTKLFNIYGR